MYHRNDILKSFHLAAIIGETGAIPDKLKRYEKALEYIAKCSSTGPGMTDTEYRRWMSDLAKAVLAKV